MLLETERLICEPAAPGHRDFAVELFGNPEVARWIWPEGRDGPDAIGPRTPEQAEQLLRRFVADWEANGFGWWCVRERASGMPVGEVVVQRATVDGAPVVEVGWMLLPAYWGRGYATEAGRAVIDIARKGLRLPKLSAGHFTDNPASGRVLEKLGFRPIGRIAARYSAGRGAAAPCKLFEFDLTAEAKTEAKEAPVRDTMAACA